MAREIVLLDEAHGEAAASGIARNADAIDAATHHQEIEGLDFSHATSRHALTAPAPSLAPTS